MERFDLRSIDLAKANSMTKYPSIPTYHALDPASGKLVDAVAVDFGDEAVFVTEKVDGTNARVVLFPDGSWLIGSREELLTASGDLVPNPAQGIVAALDEAVADLAEDWPGSGVGDGALVVLYLEVYGGKASAGSANYTGEGNVNAVLFDIATYVDWREVVEWPVAEVARWRDNVGPRWVAADALSAAWHPFDRVPAAWPHERTDIPLLERVHNQRVPTGLAETRAWMETLFRDRRTRCALDEKARGMAEGVVVRTADREKIAKLRFKDYDRALGGKR